LDYGGAVAPAVVVVPSLVNRHYILDLLPDRSFLKFLAASGLRPLVVDWGAPGVAECGFGLDDYVARLDRACAAAEAAAGAPPALLGYCMGGVLALAAALRRPRLPGLALLATPWDFHAERAAPAHLVGSLAAGPLPAEGLPVDAIQYFFFALDPFLAQRKFIRLAGLDPAGDEARRFVALEDWINDGVPLAARVATECARAWYRDNEPARGIWRVLGQRVRPEALRCPALVVVPGADRIVPPGAAAPLAERLAGAEVLRPPLGHVGMMSAARAEATLWRGVAERLLGWTSAAARL
jgi:polyhydroxyalkanoate synthase subunit PhaC